MDPPVVDGFAECQICGRQKVQRTYAARDSKGRLLRDERGSVQPGVVELCQRCDMSPDPEKDPWDPFDPRRLAEDT